MTIEDVLRKHDKALRRLPGVTGTGLGEKDGEPILIVFVKQGVGGIGSGPDPAAIPARLDGFEIDIRPEIKIGNQGDGL